MQWFTANKSIFMRSILLFWVTVLPVFFVSFAVLRWQESLLLNAYEARVDLEVSAVFAQTEAQLNAVKKQQDAMVTDSDFRYLLSKDTFDYYVGNAINSVGTKINLISANSTYVKETNVYFKSLGHRITAANQRTQYQLPQTAVMHKLLKNPVAFGLQKVDDALYIVTYPLSHKGHVNQLQYLIYSELSTERIFERLSAFAESSSSICYLQFPAYDITYCSKDSATLSTLSFVNSGESKQLFYHTYQGVKYFILAYQSQQMGAVYVQAIPVSLLFQEINAVRIWYFLLILFICLAVAIFTLMMHKTIQKPMRQLLGAFAQLEDGNFKMRLPKRRGDEFATSFISFNHMAQKLDSLINEVYAEKILVQRAELRQLQAQINPHFLYNSFFTLNTRIAAQKTEEAQQFCAMLGTYFAFITRNEQDFTTLREEVSHARVYADIQAVRFSDRVTVEFDELPQEYANLCVPKLILQPILENAFKYGLEKKEDDGTLRVSFQGLSHYVQIIVQDNGETVSTQSEIDRINAKIHSDNPLKEPSALYNINRRIQILCGEECGLFVQISELLDGLKVVVLLDVDELHKHQTISKHDGGNENADRRNS